MQRLGLGLVLLQPVAFTNGLMLVLLQPVAFTNGHVGVVLLLGFEQQDFSCDRSLMPRDARVRFRGGVGVITACCFHKLACWRSFVVVRV